MRMKLYIWEGNRISAAYHDDGLLVVLAETPQEAREQVLTIRRAVRKERARYYAARKKWHEERGLDPARNIPNGFLLAWREFYAGWAGLQEDWDGEEKALAREPDRVIELDRPCIVAFHGGGYD